MDYEIDFSISHFGINTLNSLGIKLLIDKCGGEQIILDQIRDAQLEGLLDRRVADSCKKRIRNVINSQNDGSYYRVKICGVGFIPSTLKGKEHRRIRAFISWKNMIRRIYNGYGRFAKCYENCVICEEWLDYGVFKNWYENQRGCGLKYELDKDLLGNGKLYSPETCCLLPRELNRMISDRKTKNRELPTGVKRSGKRFFAQALIGTAEKTYIYLGNFDTQEEASNAYKAFRKKRIAETAQFYYDKGELDERAYNSLINFDA